MKTGMYRGFKYEVRLPKIGEMIVDIHSMQVNGNSPTIVTNIHKVGGEDKTRSFPGFNERVNMENVYCITGIRLPNEKPGRIETNKLKFEDGILTQAFGYWRTQYAVIVDGNGYIAKRREWHNENPLWNKAEKTERNEALRAIPYGIEGYSAKYDEVNRTVTAQITEKAKARKAAKKK